MPQIVPTFYLFPPWTPQTHAANCASIYLFPQWTLQTVPTFYLFLQWTLQTPSSNCAYILFISPMNVPDTCLKLCLHLIYFFNERFRPPASNCAYILFISSMNAPDTCLKLCVNLFISSMNVPDTCLKLCLHFIYFFNDRFRPMPQIVPTIYLFPQWTPQTHASNCAYKLFISSMNAPDTCLKLCLNFIYFFNERSRDLPQIVRHLIYFLNERPRHMPQIVPTFYLFPPWMHERHGSRAWLVDIRQWSHLCEHIFLMEHCSCYNQYKY